MRVLLVDDTPTLARVTGYAFKSLGHEVQIAHTSEAAWVCLRAQTFDAVFIDVNLGSESGFDLLASLRAAGERVPAVMFTAQAEDEVADQARAAGAAGCLTKPFTLDELKTQLERAVASRE